MTLFPHTQNFLDEERQRENWRKAEKLIKDLQAAVSGGGPPTGAAGGDLSGTYPNPSIGNNTITSGKIVDGAIVNDDINAAAAIDATKMADGTVSNTEFQYINSLTSNAQTQINAKANDADVVHDTGTETIGGAKTFTSGIIANSVTSADTEQSLLFGGGQAGLIADSGSTTYFVLDHSGQYLDCSVPIFAKMLAPQFADYGVISANVTIAAPDYQRQEFEPDTAGLVIELPDPLAGNTSHEFTNNATAYNMLLDMQGGTYTVLRGGVYIIGPGETVEVSSDGVYWNPTKRRTRQIATHYADAGTPASTAETTLYTDPILGYTLYKNGDAFKAVYGGTYANNANTKRLKLKFDGTTVLDTAALTGNAAGHWRIEATFVRVSATVVRCTAQALVNGVTVTAPIVTYTAVTVANLTADRTLLLTGQNGTGTANDIVAKEALIEFVPAA